jgi:hypothetical protein
VNVIIILFVEMNYLYLHINVLLCISAAVRTLREVPSSSDRRAGTCKRVLSAVSGLEALT